MNRVEAGFRQNGQILLQVPVVPAKEIEKSPRSG
jgi:hypothetical protein